MHGCADVDTGCGCGGHGAHGMHGGHGMHGMHGTHGRHAGHGAPRMGHGRGGRRSFFKRGGLKFVLLHLLKDEARHGYDLMSEIERRSGGFYSPSPGTLYPTLQMLEDQGLVRGREVDGKRIYRITPAGEEYLADHEDHVKEHYERVKEWFEGEGSDAGATWKEDAAELKGLVREVGESLWQIRDDRDKIDAVKRVIRDAASDIKEIVES